MEGLTKIRSASNTVKRTVHGASLWPPAAHYPTPGCLGEGHTQRRIGHGGTGDGQQVQAHCALTNFEHLLKLVWFLLVTFLHS